MVNNNNNVISSSKAACFRYCCELSRSGMRFASQVLLLSFYPAFCFQYSETQLNTFVGMISND